MIYRSDIDGITVGAKCPLIVYGSVRGLVSQHRSRAAAERSLHKDQAGCRGQGGYSDASIYQWSNDRWTAA